MTRFFLSFIDRIVCYRNFPLLDFLHNGFVQFAFVFPWNEKTVKFVCSFITWATLIKPTSIIGWWRFNRHYKQFFLMALNYWINILVMETMKFFFCVFADVIKLFCICTLYRHHNEKFVVMLHKYAFTIFLPMCQDNYILWTCI